jgi:hypothetical protein
MYFVSFEGLIGARRGGGGDQNTTYELENHKSTGGPRAASRLAREIIC